MALPPKRTDSNFTPEESFRPYIIAVVAGLVLWAWPLHLGHLVDPLNRLRAVGRRGWRTRPPSSPAPAGGSDRYERQRISKKKLADPVLRVDY